MVQIEVVFCGIGSRNVAREQMNFPFIGGYEIVGRVAVVGNDVTKVSVGDNVAVGMFTNACFECAACNAGKEQCCLKQATQVAGGSFKAYGKDFREELPTFGGLSESFVCREDFVFRLPEEMQSVEEVKFNRLAGVAPLLTAGLASFVPLRKFAGKGTIVGVLGCGVVGLLAVKIAKAFGSKVFVFSRSKDK